MVRARTSWPRQRGGVLLAVAGVLTIIALSYFALFALRSTQRKLDLGATQQARLTRIDDALAQFVARNRRLPCPAQGMLADGNAQAGRESLNPVTGQCQPANQSNGVVPWITLGLAEGNARDAWNGRITYRVQPSLASNLLNLMNMSWCDPGGATNGATGPANACSPAPCASAACMHPTNYLYAKGLQVQDGAGAWIKRPLPAWSGAPAPPPVATGAAYVLIAHGANLQLGIAQGTSEADNAGGLALTGASIFVDKAHVSAPDATYFDDVLSHPTLSVVLGKAALGPRSH